MAEITLTLPDGNKRRYPAGVTLRQVADGIGGRIAKEAIAARFDGEIWDLHKPLDRDGSLELITDKAPEALDVMRHSASHIMADAVHQVFGDSVQITIGPATEEGFYYDFGFDRPFTPEDLERIEAKMKEIIAADHPFRREEISKTDARKLFQGQGQTFKVEILEGLPDGTISVYRHGNFVDLCRGPHLPSTGRVRAVKLLSSAGAYWRGDERNPMLQRIYGTAFADPKALKEHLAALEEAKRRDHRKLGKELDLFSFHKWAPASPFFHPRGAAVYNRLVAYVRELYARFGYQEVISPQVFDTELWKVSGHYDNYKDNMFFSEIDEREFGVKPMNCPGHCLLFQQGLHSYRELPLRLADFGRLHRYERSGVVQGLTRVRSFSQDDAHIFCAPEQIDAEVNDVIGMILECYQTFGFGEVRVYLSTRPEKAIGEALLPGADALWQRAEAALRGALDHRGLAYQVKAGEGAFYGPKIDFDVLDALKRPWQLGTIQLDFLLPKRFGLEFVDQDGARKQPVMIHRAMLGSLERFLGVLIEHCAGDFPAWLAPEQVRVLTVTERGDGLAQEVVAAFKAAGLRAEADLRNEKLGAKIREARLGRVPYMVVIGDDEVARNGVSLRTKADQIGFSTVPEAVQKLLEACRVPSTGAGAGAHP